MPVLTDVLYVCENWALTLGWTKIGVVLKSGVKTIVVTKREKITG